MCTTSSFRPARFAGSSTSNTRSKQIRMRPRRNSWGRISLTTQSLGGLKEFE
jgi:hypothetical protein